MSRLRAPVRYVFWITALIAGGPWVWLTSFLWERHAAESWVQIMVRAKLHANLWLLTGGVIWYAAWSFGTLLLPRHLADHRRDRALHRRCDTAMVLLIPATALLFWISGDPDPRHFRRMMPTDGVFVPAALFAALYAIALVQVCCLERVRGPEPTSVPEPGCRAGRARSPAVSAPPRQDRDGLRGWRRPPPPQSAEPNRSC